MDDAAVVSRFEKTIRDFVAARLSASGDNWWASRVPAALRQTAAARHKSTRTLDRVLGKPDRAEADYLGFDAYEKIIARRDNWREVFGPVLRDKPVFQHKMRIILSLRNDVMHHKPLDTINSLRLRLHCYDIAELIASAPADAGGGAPRGPSVARRRAALQQKYGLYDLVACAERPASAPARRRASR